MALTDNLLAFYRLDDISDSSGNNRTLTNNGNVSFAPGKIGNAAVFDGSNFLTSPMTQSGITDFSISAFVNVSDTSAQWLVSGRNSAGDMSGIELLIYSQNLYFGANGEYIISSEQINANEWIHLAGTANGSTYKIYINANLVATETKVSGSISETRPITIGSNSSGDYGLTTGQIDAVGIWSRALSDAEVAELYNNRAGGEVVDGVWVPAPPVLGYVKLGGTSKLSGRVKFGA
jgi:hypothetical protein